MPSRTPVTAFGASPRGAPKEMPKPPSRPREAGRGNDPGHEPSALRNAAHVGPSSLNGANGRKYSPTAQQMMNRLVNPKQLSNMDAQNYDNVKNMALDLIKPSSSQKRAVSPSKHGIPCLQPDWDPAAPDRFKLLLQQLASEHDAQICALQQEKQDAEERLNTMIQATWSFSEDDWHTNPHRTGEEALVIMSKDHMDRLGRSTDATRHAWTVPEDFDNPMRRVDPDKFALRQVWKYQGDTTTNRRTSHIKIEDIELADLKRTNTKSESVFSMRGRKIPIRCPMISPFSPVRVAWDVAGFFLLVYDIIMVPLNAFKPKEDVFMQLMEWCTLLFWTFDMILSFLTGYSNNGVTEMNPCKIAKHYLFRWFGVDLVIVGPDWAFTIMALSQGSSSSGDGTETVRLLRSFRIVRVLRLLRLAKLQRLLVWAKDHIHSELVLKAFNLSGFTVILLIMNHVGGAIWYFLGDLSMQNEEDNWIEKTRIKDEPLHYRYFTSFHWSLVNFGLGSMNVQPHNTVERFYAIFMVFFGMVCFAFFTAYIANALMKAEDSQSEASKQLWLLRRYLRQNKVSNSLTFRVLRMSESWCKSQKELLSENKVTILENLSDHLRSELKYNCAFLCLSKHPLFEHALALSDVVVYSLTTRALSRKAYAAKDMLFKEHVWSTCMYFLAKGTFIYQKAENADGSLDAQMRLSANDWLCEQALWCKWMTRGESVAAVDCQIIALDVADFGEAVRGDDGLWAMVSRYAENYVNWLNDQEMEEMHDVSLSVTSIALAQSFVDED